MEITNTVRQPVWKVQPEGFLRKRLLMWMGRLLKPTVNVRKESVCPIKGSGATPRLIVSLANTKEVLYWSTVRAIGQSQRKRGMD